MSDAQYGRSPLEDLLPVQRELNRMAREDPEGYMRAVAAAVAERLERERLEREQEDEE